MKRFALGVEYDGSIYHGWQYQKQASSIQEEVEKSLSIVANHKVDVICAGRTDAGVHSIGQVIHFNTKSIRKESSWARGVNHYLSRYICIKWVKEVTDNFHARYSAITRSYRYIIYNHSFRTALLHKRCNHIHKKLDVIKMNAASSYLLGEHDFSSFQSIGCQSSSPWRKIIKLQVSRINHWVIIDITANAFLQHMVRNIVGSLIQIGLSKKKEYWMYQILQKKNRIFAGPTAASKGLYLIFVDYPHYFNLPQIFCKTLFV